MSEKKRTMLLILAAILSVVGVTVYLLGFFVFSSSFADIGGVTLFIIGLVIFVADSFP